MKRRILTLLLCLLLCVSMLPTAALATDGVETHTHSLSYVSETQGCGGGYREHYVCDNCGKWFSDAEGLHEIDKQSIALPPKHVTPEDQTLITTVSAATCSSPGQSRYTCTACNQTVTETVKKLGHDLQIVEGFAETCTSNGRYTYYRCNRCGNNFWNTHAEYAIDESSTVIPMHHSLSKVEAVAPTCTSDGNIEYYVCSVCEKLFSDAAGTAEITGSTVRPALGHNIVRVEAKTATCTSAGNIEHWKCTNCSTLYEDANGTAITDANAVTLQQLAHQTVKTEAVAATCETDGNIEYWTCSVCGKHFREAAAEHELSDTEIVVPKLSHQLKEVPKKPACLTDGNIHYWICEREGCGACFLDEAGTEKITLAETVVKAAGKHDFDGGFCKECREPDPNYTGPAFKDSDLTVTPGEALVIRVDADCEATEESGWSVVIDGITISKSDITLTSGSSVFTIEGAALEALNLSPGSEHTVTVKIGEKTISAKLTVNGAPVTYQVIVSETTNGTVTVDKSTPVAGEKVTLTVAPNSNYALNTLTVKDSSETGITCSEDGDTYSFTMPASPVTVTATFAEDTSTKYTITVKNGSANRTAAAEGKTVKVTAEEQQGKRFDKWTSTPSVNFSSETASPATFTMPASNVTVTAVFKDLYKVTVSPTPANGTVTVDKSEAVEGETVKLTVTPNLNYIRTSVKAVNKTTGKQITVKDDQFTMPASDVTVSATFERIKIVKGNGGTAHYGSRYSFALNTDFEDVGVLVNGKSVSAYVDYDKGIVTLSRATIKSLTAGKNYSIDIVTNHGTASGTFWVSASPKTGDESNVALYVTAGVISAAGVAFIAWYLLKKRK